MSHIKLGKYNQLEVVKEVDFGVYLNGDEDGEILLPKRYVPEGTKPGDILNVFIYLDMEERLVATTLQPYVQVGEFACLQVAWVNQFGAFLDWGLMKDLFVPFREQKMKMQKGKRYVVHVHLDEESYRINPFSSTYRTAAGSRRHNTNDFGLRFCRSLCQTRYSLLLDIRIIRRGYFRRSKEARFRDNQQRN